MHGNFVRVEVECLQVEAAAGRQAKQECGQVRALDPMKARASFHLAKLRNFVASLSSLQIWKRSSHQHDGPGRCL